MTQTPNTPQSSELDALIQELGDICHTRYLGCHREANIWHYSYADEVVNMLDTPIKGGSTNG